PTTTLLVEFQTGGRERRRPHPVANNDGAAGVLARRSGGAALLLCEPNPPSQQISLFSPCIILGHDGLSGTKDWSVRGDRTNRRGRYGRGLSGTRCALGTRRRHQGSPFIVFFRSRSSESVRAGGTSCRRPQPSEYSRHLRHRSVA